jgi:hypothetical protein
MKLRLKTLILILLVALVCSGSAQAQHFLHYEPEVVELAGQLVLQSKYGPPNFGEQPKTDKKLRVPILVLRDRVSLLPDNGDGPNSKSAYNVRQVQLVFLVNGTSYKALIGKPVVVKGKLFHAHTGHHFTDVLMKVDSIERKPVGYDQREFAVCGITTAYSIPSKRVFMSNELETQFLAFPGEPTEKSIKLKDTGLHINAGIDYEDAFGSQGVKFDELRIALSVSKEEENALNADDHVTAGTIYKRDWQVYLTKSVVVGETQYSITLSCSDRTKRRK